MEIARAAAALFVRQGLRATRAEDIAQRAGIAPRTFYRYFATKEEAIAPLYAAGSLRWTEAVRTAPAELPVLDALEHAVRHTLAPGVGVSAASWEWARTLVRLAEGSPAARKVWAEVCQDSERILAEVLAERVGRGGRVGRRDGGGQVGGADQVGSADQRGGDGPGDDQVGDGPGDGQVGDGPGDDNVALGPPVSARLRFAAAVAGAAVRVAVESWATGDETPGGPQGPAALALRNVEALRGFDWGEAAGD